MLILNKQLLKFKTIGLLSLGLLSMHVQAAPITLIGTSFNVVYDSSLVGLFGTPTLSGNAVFFTPVAFKAESLNGLGVVTANSTVNLSIIEHAGKNITSFDLVELGDYRLVGANSIVGIGGQTRVFDIANPFIQANNQITTTSNLSIINTIFDSTTHDWSSSSSVAVTSLQWANTTSYNYTIENLLTSYTDPAGTGPKIAFIEKKFAGSSISIVVTTVPEVNTYAMLIAGLGFVGFISRRKNLYNA